MELVCWVDSMEAMRAVIAGGADAVRLGLRGASARGLELARLLEAAQYCRVRGVRCCIAMEKPVSTGAIQPLLDAALQLAAAGADALLVGDLGLLRALHFTLPELPLHAAPALGLHDSTGAALLASLGGSRLLLPPQLGAEDLRRIAQRRLTETETVLLGDCCTALGHCRLASFPVRTPGDCRRLCFGGYSTEGSAEHQPIGSRDIGLGSRLLELTEAGLTALCIRCQGRSPAAAAMAADVFHRALRDGKPPSRHDLALLYAAFSPGGVSSGYYAGTPQEALLDAVPRRRGRERPVLPGAVAAEHSGGEFQRVPVTLRAEVRRGAYSRITAEDDRGNRAEAVGPAPAAAGNGRRELTAALLRTQLFNTLGTPFLCTEAHAELDPGLHLPSVEVSRLRLEALERLRALRRRVEPPRTGLLPPLLRSEPRREAPDLSISVCKAAQLSEELAGLKPALLTVPLAELLETPAAITPFWENGVTRICAALPPWLPDSEALDAYRALHSLKELHIEDVRISSLSQLLTVRRMGFRVRGGVELEVRSDRSLRVLQELGLHSAVLSPELRREQLAALSKCMDTELYAYGRVPLLISGVSLSEAFTGAGDGSRALVLRDSRGRQHPVLPAPPGRSTLYSPEKLFLADRLRDWDRLGFWCYLLAFTTENARECRAIAERYLGFGSYEPNARTRGRYYEDKARIGLRLPKKAGAAGPAGSV